MTSLLYSERLSIWIFLSYSQFDQWRENTFTASCLFLLCIICRWNRSTTTNHDHTIIHDRVCLPVPSPPCSPFPESEFVSYKYVFTPSYVNFDGISFWVEMCYSSPQSELFPHIKCAEWRIMVRTTFLRSSITTPSVSEELYAVAYCWQQWHPVETIHPATT